MSAALIWIALIGLLARLWLDGARARELAIGIAESMCRRRGLQFLDETVSLQRVGVRWGPGGVRLRRLFSFDFSIEGMGRRSGYLILRGTQVESFDLGLPQPAQAEAPPPEPEPEPPAQVQPGDNVVPFRRPPRH